MIANMLSLSNTLADTIGAGPSRTEPLAVKKRNQSSPTSIDGKPLTKARKNETVDNTQVKRENKINVEPAGEFSHTFRKEITSKVSQEAKNSRNVLKKSLIPNTTGQPNVIQPLLAKWSLGSGHGPEGIVKKAELESGLEHAQLYNNLGKDESLLRAGETAKPQNSEPVPIVSSKQIGLKETFPKASQASFAAGIPEKGQNGEGLILKPLIRANHEITTINGKPADVPISDTLGNQQTPFLSVEGLKPRALVNAAGEITNVIQQPYAEGKPVVSIGREVPLSKPNIPPVQDRPSGLPFQAVTIEPEKTPLIAENAVGNKAATGQPNRTQTQQLSGPLAEDAIEQGPNSSGNPAYQYLHQAQLQVFTGPIKGRNSSVSNNNANSGFEQIFSGNNAAACIGEQTSAFSEDITTDNLPTQISPGGISVSITEQILESIQSSSIQQEGTQKITIRLNPPELGKVIIKFEEQENQIIGLLEVDKTHTRYEVEQALPQILQNLLDSGIQIKRLEVMLTDQNEQPSYGEESLRDGLFQQHHDLPGGSNPDSPGTLDTNDLSIFGNNSSYQDGPGPQMQISADSINILI